MLRHLLLACLVGIDSQRNTVTIHNIGKSIASFNSLGPYSGYLGLCTAKSKE